MRLHGNAALSLKKRKLLVARVIDEGWSLTEAAAAAEVSERTAGKWVRRFEAEGEAGLLDRPSAARNVHNRTPELRVQAIAALRRLRFTGANIAEILAMPETTVSGILRRIGLGKLGRLGVEPAVRYERQRPGELLHIDVKKLGRILLPGHRVTGNRRQRAPKNTYTADGRRIGDAGWEYVHVCVDDATRLAYAEVLHDEKATTTAAFLRRAVAFYRRHGIVVEAVLTDNGAGYRSALHSLCCRMLGLKHLRTKPYRPQTNGKAERFIRTLLGEWAYGAIYGSSSERTAALAGFLWRHNFKRNHGALGRKPPAARLAELNNALGSYT
jgi:transposase InsO family protein/transposase